MGLLMTTTFMVLASLRSICCILCRQGGFCSFYFPMFATITKMPLSTLTTASSPGKKELLTPMGKPFVICAFSSSYLAWRMLTPSALSLWQNTEK